MYDSKKLPFCLACIPGEVKPKPKPPKIDQTQPTSRAKHQPTKHLISHSSPRNIPSVDSATFNPAMPN